MRVRITAIVEMERGRPAYALEVLRAAYGDAKGVELITHTAAALDATRDAWGYQVTRDGRVRGRTWLTPDSKGRVFLTVDGKRTSRTIKTMIQEAWGDG